MLCHKVMDEHIRYIRFAFQVPIHLYIVMLCSSCSFTVRMYTDGLSRRWRDTAPFGTVWIDMVLSIYALKPFVVAEYQQLY